MAILEHSSCAPLAEIFENLDSESREWGFAVVKRHYLRAMTNEAFLMAIRSIFQGVDVAHIAYDGNQSIFIAWKDKQRLIYRLLRNLASTSLMQPGLAVEGRVLVTYLDPSEKRDEIRKLLQSGTPRASSENELSDLDDSDESVATGMDALSVSPEQVTLYQEACTQKPYRHQLHILVAEDEVFSQKLLLEILRGVRIRNNNDSPTIDTVQTLREAWKLFLKKAPDIVFIDLNLADGSGHTLARAIKELDPTSQVIIITANNFEEEVNVARQNNVDGFITKPYNKKQILDGIDRYIEATKPVKGLRRGNLR